MLRAATLALACSLASACQSCGPVERGRYQCDPKLRPEEDPESAPQCPGPSRCGLEGYCHNAGDVSVAWRCETRAHCENGYECGLSRDRTHRECHNPEAADAGFACDFEDDCVRGWHCGVEKVCYDRNEKKPYPCRRTAAGAKDCATGWRCGVDDVCHDTAVASDYPCSMDQDCEQQWRCGVDGRCLDPTRDALRPANTTLGAARRVSPLLLDSTPELLAASPVQSPSFNVPRQFLAYYARGEVTVLDLLAGGAPPIGTNPHRVQVLADAGEVTALASLGALSYTATGKIDPGSWTYLTRPDGGFDELHFRTNPTPDEATYFRFDGGPLRMVEETVNFEPVTTAPERLRIGTTTAGRIPTMVAFDQRPFPGPLPARRQYWFGWGARSRAYFRPFYSYDSDYADLGSDFEVAGNRVLDFAAVTAHSSDLEGAAGQADCVLLADTRGLFVQQLEVSLTGVRRYGPRPVLVPPFHNQRCATQTGQAQNYRITSLATMDRDWLAVAAHPMDGGVVQPDVTEVALIDVSRWWDVVNPTDARFPFRGCYVGPSSGACVPDTTVIPNALPVTASVALGPCRVCSGGQLVALSVVPSPGSAKLEARCRYGTGDGGATDAVVGLSASVGTSCARATLQLSSSLGSDPVALSSSNSGQLAFAGPRGHLWVGRSTSSALPVFFDEAATGVVSDERGLAVFLSAERVGWAADPSLGIYGFALHSQDTERPVAPVEGAPKAMVTAGRELVTLEGVALGDPPARLAGAALTATRFDPPYHAAQVASADGGAVVVVSAGDVILAAQLGLARPQLERQVVPSEGKTIISLVALPWRPGAPSLTAFALTSSALFRIAVEADGQWSAAPALLPPGAPLELWADGARGRIGYSDGRVFSLETRVQVGAALGKRVDDFAQACGQPYALAEGELYRLSTNPDGGAIGGWSAVPLDAGLPEGELAKGTLLPFAEADGGTTVYLFSRRGEALAMPVGGCP